jgi:Carboxypeptidase regulatory-like domain
MSWPLLIALVIASSASASAWSDCSEPDPVQLTSAGKIIGTVALDDHQPLPGVTVTLRSGNVILTRVSDRDGRFTFFNVPPGVKFRVSAELAGLTNSRKKDVSVIAAGTAEISLRMHLDESEVVCVDCGNATRVPPDGPALVITREMMDRLPIH